MTLAIIVVNIIPKTGLEASDVDVVTSSQNLLGTSTPFTPQNKNDTISTSIIEKSFLNFRGLQVYKMLVKSQLMNLQVLFPVDEVSTAVDQSVVLFLNFVGQVLK